MKEHETVYLGGDLCLLCYVYYFSFLPAFFDLLILFVCIYSYVNLLAKQKPALYRPLQVIMSWFFMWGPLH